MSVPPLQSGGVLVDSSKLYDHAPTSSHSLDPEDSFVFPVVTYNSSFKWTSKLLLLRTPPHARGLSDRYGTHTGLLTCNPHLGRPSDTPTLTIVWRQAKSKSRSHYHQSNSSAFLLSPDFLGKNQTPGHGSLSFSERRETVAIYLAVSQSPVAKPPSWPERTKNAWEIPTEIRRATQHV